MRHTRTGRISFVVATAMSVLFTAIVIVGLLNRLKIVRFSSAWLDYAFGGFFISVALAIVGAILGTIALFQKGSRKILPLISTVLSGLILLLFGGLLIWANSREVRVSDVSIVEFGRYDKSTDSLQHPGLVCVESTDTIDARLGGRFGIGYLCKGEPDGFAVPVKLVWVFPPPGAWDSTRGEFKTKVTRDSMSKIGETGHYWYMFDYNWELLPGIWTCQVFTDDKHYAEKQFMIVRR